MWALWPWCPSAVSSLHPSPSLLGSVKRSLSITQNQTQSRDWQVRKRIKKAGLFPLSDLATIYPGQKKQAFQTWFPVLTSLEEPNKRSRTERAPLNWKEYKPRFYFHSFRKVSCDSWLGELPEISGIYLPLFPSVFLFYYYHLYFYVLNQIWGSIIILKCDCCRAVKKRVIWLKTDFLWTAILVSVLKPVFEWCSQRDILGFKVKMAMWISPSLGKGTKRDAYVY